MHSKDATFCTMSWRSVVYLSVGRDRESCRNGGTDRCAGLGVDLG